jgi:hypothetical protein
MDRHEELLEREAESWRALLAEVEGVPSERRPVEGVVPGWSVSDLVHHCGGWAAFAADHLEVLGSGAFVDPFEGAADDHWDRISQEMIESSRGKNFDDVLRGAEEARLRVRSVWEALPDAGEDAARFFAEETSEHYDEHRAEIRAFRERT